MKITNSKWFSFPPATVPTKGEKVVEDTRCDSDGFKEKLKKPGLRKHKLVQEAIQVAQVGETSGDLSKIGEILAGGTCEGQSRNGRTGADSMLGQMQRNPNLPIAGLDGAVK